MAGVSKRMIVRTAVSTSRRDQQAGIRPCQPALVHAEEGDCFGQGASVDSASGEEEVQERLRAVRAAANEPDWNHYRGKQEHGTTCAATVAYSTDRGLTSSSATARQEGVSSLRHPANSSAHWMPRGSQAVRVPSRRTTAACRLPPTAPAGRRAATATPVHDAASGRVGSDATA